jgi:TolB protein
VLEKRSDKWLIVQMHFSFAADKVAAAVKAKLAKEDHGTRGQVYPIIFYSGRGDNQDVYILYPGEKEPRNLTNHAAKDLCPAVSPDGRFIIFQSVRDGNFDIFSIKIDGSDPLRLTNDPAWDGWASYVPHMSQRASATKRNKGGNVLRAPGLGNEQQSPNTPA